MLLWIIFPGRQRVKGADPVTGERKERMPDLKEPFSALIFKIATDPHVGSLTLRVYSGKAGLRDLYKSAPKREKR